eukprot:TRINITY_DN2623_c0_g1_i1.p1 TRINITY_DN2623_c0_g1~~TRINITY_DN2623_c0_g1_i1.p1  ORF type:complete len:272 (+),score=45.52 TRINITY_DN2623_c0_g1_i1:360-1175(+)
MADTHDLNCVCDVCTCGRHRCPPSAPKERHYDPSLLQTTNQRDLKEWPLNPSEPFQPPAQLSPSGKFMGQTAYQSAFTPPPADGYARQPAVEAAGGPPQRPFVGKSTYDRDFTEHDGDGRMPVQGSAVHLQRHHGEGIPSGPFMGETTYKHEFVPKEGMRSDPLMVDPDERPSLPFNGNTTYNRDYPGYDAEATPALAHGERYTPNTAPFNDHTSYRDNYTGAQPEPCPATALSARPPSPDGHVYYRKSSVDQQVKQARTGHTPEARKLAF